MKVSKLTAIIVSTLALSCNKPESYPSQGSVHHSIIENLITKKSFDFKRYDDLIKKNKLTREEFTELIYYVDSHEKLFNLIKKRGIYYPDDSIERKFAIEDLSYSSPLETHNRRYGVCDELGLYVVPFLLQISTVKEVTITECQGEFISNGKEDKNAIHSFVIFKENGRWRYYNNLKLSEVDFPTKMETAIYAAKDTGFTLKSISFKEKQVGRLGEWAYKDKDSLFLKPSLPMLAYCER